MKKLLVITCVVLACLSFAGFTSGHQPDYKNLQVLPKDISKHDLDSIMKFYALSLGVRCNFCHARTEDNTHLDFASDAKGEKKITRKMMLMTTAINRNNFHDPNDPQPQMQMVTCYTCHRGMEQPETKLPDSVWFKPH